MAISQVHSEVLISCFKVGKSMVAPREMHSYAIGTNEPFYYRESAVAPRELNRYIIA